MKKKYIMLISVAAAASAFSAGQKTTTAPVTAVTAQKVQEFRYGGDIRLRSVYFDNIPYANGGEARGGINSFQRYRTRIWGEYHPQQNTNLYFRGRLVNEWRSVQEPRTRNAWAAFDETVLDNLFVDYKTGLFDFRIGRQDLIYGTGKVILDGTPLDGSRTIYFDAAKATYHGIDQTTVDFLAIYTHAQDPLAIHSQDRNLVGLGGTPYEGVEAGGGIYVKNKSHKDLPWEAYWLVKTEEDDINNRGASIPDPINTVGTRLMPKFCDGLSGNLEMAYQSTPQTDAFMIDALATMKLEPLEDQKATLGAGWYHLSEDWDPLWARWPQYSELYVYSYDTTGGGRWANVSMPHIDFSVSPCKAWKSDVLLGYMFAPQDNGPGGGHNRGMLFTWWNRFTLKEGVFTEKDKVTGHLLLEVFDPADYYSGSQRDHTAAFLRGELSYTF